jgi:hypothetical protein
MNCHPRCFPAVILIAASCVSSGGSPGAAAPADPAGNRQAGEAIRVEPPISVEPYVGRPPIIRVRQSSYWGHSPSFDFVVFDDGAVFFEGKSCVGEVGLRKAILSPVELAGLKALAEPKCAQLFRPIIEGFRMVGCTHVDHAVVSCATIDGDARMGSDCEGSELFGFASDLIDRAKVRIWIGTPARQDSSCRSGKRYTAAEIDRMLGPARAR